MDRIAPTRRPERRAVMFQRWRQLGFFHWPVPAEALAALLPARLSVDTWEGQAFIGLVPFTVRGARAAFLPPWPGLSSFHEINVRTYVFLDGQDPGVWFFSLDANRWPIVAAARALFHLDYRRAAIAFGRDGLGAVRTHGARASSPGRVPAEWSLAFRPAGPPHPAEPGSLEHFLAERYILYAAHGDRLYQGRVHHAPYPLQDAEVSIERESLIAAAGLRRAAAPPTLAHCAAGVDVEVFALRRVR